MADQGIFDKPSLSNPVQHGKNSKSEISMNMHKLWTGKTVTVSVYLQLVSSLLFYIVNLK